MKLENISQNPDIQPQPPTYKATEFTDQSSLDAKKQVNELTIINARIKEIEKGFSLEKLLHPTKINKELNNLYRKQRELKDKLH